MPRITLAGRARRVLAALLAPPRPAGPPAPRAVPGPARPAHQPRSRTDHARDSEALDLAAAPAHGTAEATRAAALAAGISDTQWTYARSVVLHAPHLAGAVRSGKLPLAHAAMLARAYRYDPATAERAERSLTGDMYRNSRRVQGARADARRTWQAARPGRTPDAVVAQYRSAVTS